ncbi:hypothetical protein [Breoghania sp.]|uniref:hypothetical protein n=1 Tax=Breoghania sp. TaxID=2065378 RepID=UPI002603ECFD|nr:hypothetical protein [Breoghania sp.]MDJ0933384.1 hypothetical protein [Breoghania sp.]
MDWLRAWLDWQFPKHHVVVLLAENAGDVKLEDLGIPDDRLPVIINPFLLPPLLSEPHVLIDFADVVVAMALPDPADAIKAPVVAKASWDLVLPWDKQGETERDAELARFLNFDPQELVHPPGFEATARMLGRLCVVPRWKQRHLFKNPADAALTANLCLSYCGAGHVAEAFAAILHARNKLYELRGTVHVDDFLEDSGMNDRIVDQALSMVRRWHRMHRLEPPNLHKRAMQTLLCRLWLHNSEGYDREAIELLAAQTVLDDDTCGARDETGKSIVEWLLAEGILIASGSGTGARFFSNPAHVLTTIEY